jgi:hypothetical protein
LSRENSTNARALVERLNRMIQSMDVEGIRALAAEHPLETIEASNYVNSKFRFAVQEIVSASIQASNKR